MPVARPSLVHPGAFEAERHYYARALNAQLHPLVRYFFSLDNARIVERYTHLHPETSVNAVYDALRYVPRWYRWGGTDLLHVAAMRPGAERGRRKLVVIETNSCPSGQKSMPWRDEHAEQAGYRELVERAWRPMLREARRRLPAGGLAVLFDKNPMEASAYAAVIADVMDEPVALVPFYADDPDPCARFVSAGAPHDAVLEVRGDDGAWQPMRAAFRYVTQRPWSRIPPVSRTLVLNPVLVCLAGGRNKMLAAKAYDFHNGRLRGSGLQIAAPETIWDVDVDQVPAWVERLGGLAVVKVPYSNAGQGVFTITDADELAAFMASEHRYDRVIVQALVGNAGWSSVGRDGRLFHVGTVPDKRRQIFVADLRFMVGAGPEGFFPVAIYGRRARAPLTRTLDAGASSSWDMLGTNLSVRQDDGAWTTESERLLMMDQRDFNRLGLGIDELIEGYIQTVMAVTAIDEMARTLVNSKGAFRHRYFGRINPDDALSAEVMR